MNTYARTRIHDGGEGGMKISTVEDKQNGALRGCVRAGDKITTQYVTAAQKLVAVSRIVPLFHYADQTGAGYM